MVGEGQSLQHEGHDFMIPRHGGQVAGQQRGGGKQQMTTDKHYGMALTKWSSSSLLLQVNNSSFLYCSGKDFSISEKEETHTLSPRKTLQDEVFVFLCFTNIT